MIRNTHNRKSQNALRLGRFCNTDKYAPDAQEKEATFDKKRRKAEKSPRHYRRPSRSQEIAQLLRDAMREA